MEVELQDGTREKVKPYRWDINRYFWNQETKSVASETIGSFRQYPLKLAWAITIHKSQGKTFDQVVIDLGQGTLLPDSCM